MVTSGAASGVVLSIAACMSGTDVARIRQLPDASGMPDEVVVQKIHRGAYSHMYTFSGARLIDVGDMDGCLSAELDAAIGPRTAAVAYLLGPRIGLQGLSLPQVVEVAHRRGVPVIVDAAAMLPPKENLRRFIAEGADLVTFSGGKMIHGPQNTGILCGRSDLVAACLANASPNHAIGRPHKVSREDMVGLYVALKQFVARDEADSQAAYRRRLKPIVQALQGVPDIHAEIVHDGRNYNVPVVAISFAETWPGPPGRALPALMLGGEPAIFMQYFAGLGHLVVNPVSLQPGEPEIVGERLRAVLCAAHATGPASVRVRSAS
jgi:D-glucosaminate-6-phosphate ammonia-lyase